MKPLLPSGEEIAASAARARQREREENVRREAAKGRLRAGLLLLAAVAVVALLADMRHLARHFERPAGKPAAIPGDAADVAAGLNGPRYVDPSGRFSFVPPRHWVRVAKPPNEFYDVVFQGPYDMDMCVQVIETNGPTFDGLIESLRRVERNLSADTHMDFTYVGPYRAVKRSVQLFRNRVLLLDFLTGDLAHHVQFSAPPDLYDQYEPVFLRLMQTYEPGQIMAAPAAPDPAAPAP